MSTRTENPRARYRGRVEVGATSVVGGVDKINCTYPIDFNPRTLCTRFRTRTSLLVKKIETY